MVALLSVPRKERTPEWRMANGAVQAAARGAWLAYMAGECRRANGGPAQRSVDDILNEHLTDVAKRHGLTDNG